jgi:hypothetical protein
LPAPTATPLNGRTRTRNIPNTRQPGDGGCWMDEPVEREMNYAEMADTLCREIERDRRERDEVIEGEALPFKRG